MTDQEIARINELARLKKQRPLTPEEAAEQQRLRRGIQRAEQKPVTRTDRHIDAMKKSLQEDLDRMLVQDETGAYVPVRQKKPKSPVQ